MFRRGGALYWNVPPNSGLGRSSLWLRLWLWLYSNPWSPWLPSWPAETFRRVHWRVLRPLPTLLRDGLNCQPGWSTRRTSTSSTGKGWRKELFRSLLVFSFKNKVILKPCQGCANRSVETRPFPLLTVCSPIEPTYLRTRFFSWVGRRRRSSITAAKVPLSGHTPGTLMLASGWDPDLELGLGPGIPPPPPPFLPWGFQLPRQSPRHCAPLKPHKKGHASLYVEITM